MHIRVALVACLFAVGGLGGCGSSDSVTQTPEKFTPAAALRQGVDRTVSDSYRHRWAASIDDVKISGAGEYRGGPTSASRNRIDPDPTYGGGSEEIRIGQERWSRSVEGPGRGATFDDEKWSKASVAVMAVAAETPYDVGKRVRLLLAATELREIGPEQVAGVQATRYTATATVQSVKAATGLGDEEKEAHVRDLEGGPAAHLEAWLDGDFRIRKFVDSRIGDGLSYRVTWTLDYSAAVDITPPPAAQVFDIDKEFPEQKGKSLNELFFDSLSKKEQREACENATKAHTFEEELLLPMNAEELRKLCARKG